MTDFKALKKLADACRKAGITHFKNAEFEFTLSENGPVSNYKRRLAKKETVGTVESPKQIINEHTLTEDQLLFWSAANLTEEESAHEN